MHQHGLWYWYLLRNTVHSTHTVNQNSLVYHRRIHIRICVSKQMSVQTLTYTYDYEYRTVSDPYKYYIGWPQTSPSSSCKFWCPTRGHKDQLPVPRTALWHIFHEFCCSKSFSCQQTALDFLSCHQNASYFNLVKKIPFFHSDVTNKNICRCLSDLSVLVGMHIIINWVEQPWTTFCGRFAAVLEDQIAHANIPVAYHGWCHMAYLTCWPNSRPQIHRCYSHHLRFLRVTWRHSPTGPWWEGTFSA